MSAGEVASLIGAVGVLVAAVVAYRKFGPESRRISVEAVDINVTYAGRVRDLAVSDWERVSKELDDLRQEFNQYKRDTEGRLAEMAVEVRAARAGEEEAKRQAKAERSENQKLRRRVQALETEVARLKANDHP